jgi:hypothetical protein
VACRSIGEFSPGRLVALRFADASATREHEPDAGMLLPCRGIRYIGETARSSERVCNSADLSANAQRFGEARADVVTVARAAACILSPWITVFVLA